MLQCLGSIDLTTLHESDTMETGRSFARNVNAFAQAQPQLPNVAAICVYPALVEAVRKTLTVPGVKIAAVGAGFPASQTLPEVKALECALCVDSGADEVDIVLSLNRFLAGEYDLAAHEIQLVRTVMDKASADKAGRGGVPDDYRAHLKVILETGVLKSDEAIARASWLAMENGADFIKTSTGKTAVSATPQAARVMCGCIKSFYEKTGRKIGFKPAGGITTSAEALVYRDIVDEVLGSEWLNPSLFRIGASRLANNLLQDILHSDVAYF